MPGPFDFDAYLGWVNITDPNNIPADARTIDADDLLRYENMGLAAKEKFAEVDAAIEGLDSDAVMSTLIAEPSSEVRYVITTMVDAEVTAGVSDFQAVIDAVPDNVAGQVPPLVTSALASDSTVANAAAAAVNGKLTEAGVLTGASTTESDEVVFSMTDAGGRRSWIEIAPDGGPPARTVQWITADLPLPEVHGGPSIAYAVTDAQGRRSWIEIAQDGRPTDYARQLMFEGFVLPAESVSSTSLTDELNARVEAGNVQPEDVPEITGTTPNRTLYINQQSTGKRVPVTGLTDPHNPRMTVNGHVVVDTATRAMHVPPGSTEAYPLLAVEMLAFWGDSLTDSGAGDYYPTKAATILGLPFFQGGVSGQASSDIALRQGSLQPTVTFTGGSIPAGTELTTVTLSAPEQGFRLEGTSVWDFPGELRLPTGAVIPGKLVRTTLTKTWQFSRTTAGSVIAVPAGATFVSAVAEAHRGDIQVFWPGRNNINPNNDLLYARRDLEAMIAYQSAYHRKFIVMGVTNGKDEKSNTTGAYQKIVLHNQALSDTYGDRYFDVRRAFIDRGLAIAGITPTQADLDAIALDAPPPSLMADGLHPTTAGYEAIGTLVAEFITSKGWAN